MRARDAGVTSYEGVRAPSLSNDTVGELNAAIGAVQESIRARAAQLSEHRNARFSAVGAE